MTAQILASELGNLIQESKRKNNDLRIVSLCTAFGSRPCTNSSDKAAEKSLEELKSLRTTSEAQISAGRISQARGFSICSHAYIQTSLNA